MARRVVPNPTQPCVSPTTLPVCLGLKYGMLMDEASRYSMRQPLPGKKHVTKDKGNSN